MPITRLGPMYDPLRSRGQPLQPFIYIGFVKDNADAQRMGRLSVWIPEMGGEPDDASSWVIASYASPFAGATDLTQIPGYTTNTQVAQQSYGLWMVPPDLNNEVVVFFANGDISRAYWFACTFQQNMNHMVPGIAVDITTEPSPPIHISPTIEYNKADKSQNVNAPRRPPFQPLTAGLSTEGLTTDLERGVASTSARREAPSQVYGLLTPRGSTMHIDDNTANEFIRLRTRSGAQVLIHETSGYVYINSKNGNAWLEISDAGVDIYSANSVSIRAQGDFNVRADRDILLDAGGNLRLSAGADITMAAGGNIQQQATSKINLNASSNIELTTSANIFNIAAVNFEVTTGSDLVTSIGNDLQTTVIKNSVMSVGHNLETTVTHDSVMSVGNNLETNVTNDWVLAAGSNIETNATANWVLSVGSDSSIKTNDFNVNAADTINMQTGASFNIKSGNELFLTSAANTEQRAGGLQVRDGTAIRDDTGAATYASNATANQATAPSAPTAPIAPITLTPPVLPPRLTLGDAKQRLVNNQSAWHGGADQITTIVHRMPTHEPWREHPNADVPPPPTTCIEINDPGTFDAGSSSNTNAPTTVTTGSGATATIPGTLNNVGCSTGASGTKPISTDVYNAIMSACTKTGADPATMLAFADMESSFQPGVGAKGSSATGLYQFTQGTWNSMVAKYGNQYSVGYSQINDAVGNSLMGGQYLNDNIAILQRNGVSNPTPGQCYIMHFAGSSGGLKLISASQQSPDADASSMFPAAAAANPTIFRGKTTSQVVASLSATADAKAKAYAGQYGLPAPCDREASGNPATPLNPTVTAATELTAPQPVNLNTQVAASVPVGDGRPPPPAPTVMTVPVGGTGQVCQAGTNPIQTGANGYVGSGQQAASMLAAAGLSNPSQWRKGSTVPTTWSKNQPIAIFNSDGSYNSHAALFLSLVHPGNPNYNGVSGLLVYQQATGQPAQQIIIPYDVANANNATLYAAVNTPQGSGGGGGGTGGGGSSGTGTMEPDFTANPQGANRVRSACIQAYPSHTGDCSGFVKAVGQILGVTITGDANAITAQLQSGGWTPLASGAAAASAAAAGQFVVAGLNGHQQASPNVHGHVVVVVAGPVIRGNVPTAYWGALGGVPGAYQTVNYAWVAADLPKVTYAARALS